MRENVAQATRPDILERIRNFRLMDDNFLFVNGECRDDSPLGRLMQDFFCTNPDDMHYAPLRERARYFKEDEKGVMIMSSASEELREEGRKEGENRLAKLISFLLKNGKQDEIERATSHPENLPGMYVKYGIS